jgi:predicted NUDIX family NTP pyrophosphohydrolase
MPRLSAGLLLYRKRGGEVEVLLAHMGGPLWSNRDARAWSLPKGEYEPGEDPLAAARREFSEELGTPPPQGPGIDIGSVKQSGGKIVQAWALEGDLDAGAIKSNSFQLEWPRGSGRVRTYPEVDRAAWFDLQTAREKLVRGQVAFLDRLREQLG